LGLVALALMLLAAPSAGTESGFKVIVHPSVPESGLSRDELSRFFLKKAATWKDGSPVVPIDQGSQSPVRAEFSEAVHGRSVNAVKSYWQNLIFAGRAVPPPEEGSDEAVMKAVRETPGAVGYVSAAARPMGVKVLAVALPSTTAGPALLDPDQLRRQRIEGHEPAYPPTAQRNEEEGVVVAKIVISPEGKVTEVVFTQTHPAFESTVRQAVNGWKFKPQPVAAYSIVKFTFKLQ
jgi:TonB family protein